MTAAELIKVCKQYEAEHGIADTLLLLNDIILGQSAGQRHAHRI